VMVHPTLLYYQGEIGVDTSVIELSPKFWINILA